MQLSPTQHAKRLDGYILALGVLGYAGLNFVGLVLAAQGIIHPPWGLFEFFSFVGPLCLISAILFMQFAASRRFGWIAATGGIACGVIFGLLNLMVFAQASAAV